MIKYIVILIVFFFTSCIKRTIVFDSKYIVKHQISKISVKGTQINLIPLLGANIECMDCEGFVDYLTNYCFYFDRKGRIIQETTSDSIFEKTLSSYSYSGDTIFQHISAVPVRKSTIHYTYLPFNEKQDSLEIGYSSLNQVFYEETDSISYDLYTENIFVINPSKNKKGKMILLNRDEMDIIEIQKKHPISKGDVELNLSGIKRISFRIKN